MNKIHTNSLRHMILALALLVPLAACSSGSGSGTDSSGDPEADRRADVRVGADDGKPKAAGTLYERIGGADRIAAIVDDFTDRVIADPRVNFARRNVRTGWVGRKYTPWEPTPANVDRFKARMNEFLMLAAGGPPGYAGREIREVHKGMVITNNEFDALVGDLKTSMDRLGVATREKRDLLAIVETTRKQIVEKP